MNKILIIEDHYEVRENLHELLELCNYEVLSAPNGEKGIQEAISAQPDLILCDIMMPGIDGYEVLATLAQQPETAAIPFIFLSARADKADIRRGMLLGADDYVTKPFEEQDLLRAIQVRLHKSHLLKQPFQKSFEGLNSFLFQARQEGGLPLDADIHPGIRKYETGEFIFRENDSPEHLFFLASGNVRVYRPQPEPPSVFTDYDKGNFFGYKALISGENYLHRAQALEPAEVSFLSKNDFFLLLLYNRTFSIRFIQLLANQVKEQEKQLLRLLQDLSRRKVADAILELCPPSASGSRPEIPLTDILSRSRIANLTLTIALRHLDSEQAISLRQDCIQLIDSGKLRSLANA
jgi:CheY-like chemotaxis protein/CRP-like cAMP-binding protein